MNTQSSAYEFSDTLKQYYSDKADALLLGEKYLFYLDHNGKIAGYDLMGASTDNYIYVYGTYFWTCIITRYTCGVLYNTYKTIWICNRWRFCLFITWTISGVFCNSMRVVLNSSYL